MRQLFLLSLTSLSNQCRHLSIMIEIDFMTPTTVHLQFRPMLLRLTLHMRKESYIIINIHFFILNIFTCCLFSAGGGADFRALNESSFPA